MSTKQNTTNRSNMTERCRICLADNGCMISLRNERVESKLKDLVKCTFVDIKHEENLPAFVCHVCLYKLNMWSEFKERFIQSNKILLGQLQASEVSDTNNKNSKNKNEKNTDGSIKRKRLSENTENTVSEHNDTKKTKIEASSSEITSVDIKDQGAMHTIYISDDAEVIVPKNPDKTVNSDDSKLKENGDEPVDNKPSAGLNKSRLLPGKRGRAIERRKASTKRWVERKKALLAATGENVSDSDSVASDDAQMSPVQKARAKTNADKETERQKRIAKVLKNLETSFTEKYTAIRDIDHIDTDPDIRKTRNNKELHSSDKQDKQDKNVKRTKSASQEHSTENTPVVLVTKDAAEERAHKSESQANEKAFIPRMIKSELMVGNDRYVVTSTLIRTGTSRLSKEALNNLSKEGKSPNTDDSSQEKNTDIIEAVQLRRVHPAPSNSNSKKYERCLNVDVETTELESLKRVQVGLADFVENEMKQKLLGTNDDGAKVDRTENSYGKAYRKLDQQLKGIVKKTIISNVETSFMRDTIAPMKQHDQPFTVSSDFIEMVKNSSLYQPLVIVERMDIEKESKLRKINNTHMMKQVTPKSKLIGPFSSVSRKRQSVPPKRYNDYNTSALESDSDEINEVPIQETRKTTSTPIVKTYSNVAAKQSLGANNQIPIIKRVDTSAVKIADNNVTVSVYTIEQRPMVKPKEEKPDYEESIKIEGAIAENHICGVCGLSFNSRKDVEMHVRSHKVTVPENNTATVTRKSKVKRCKRCQTLVDARYVKSHVCKTSTPLLHKCYVCNSTFRTEKLLVRHLDNHDQSEFTIENIKKVDSSKVVVPAKPGDGQEPKIEILAKPQGILTEKNIVQTDKTTNTGTKLIDDTIEKPKETYTCFVCDKIFTDEEVLKDHLQKHCDDLSEDEQSNNKEQYQCAICGDTMESDQALEEHVGKHLFDDEDDNPNLIRIEEQEDDQSKIYQCGQCSEMFDSEVLLEIHVQAHEEEVAIAEWEKKETNVHPYECMLCGECINTEMELAEHLDVIHNICNAEAQVCQLCEQPFNTLEELQEHVAIH
ncbi:Zinc finger protein 26 [Harpegnathos saltator]|uniref:Zinc finger protein 26 n=1 Tax=Harpegnathos saltator TaxID=610380 RepID=E2C1C7_HARSA|nr:Zinc finger protein 26 [Harpegnathos saltator]